MSTTTTQAAATLRATRLIKVPRERVFAAWTTPADIVKWFGPETCRVLSATVDLRVGGEYRFRVKSDYRGEVEVSGVYREVKPPARLVYTWDWSGNPEMSMGETLVTVDFVERNGFTEVQLTHDRFPNTEARDQHNHGWIGTLDKLAAYFGPTAGEFCWNELLTSDVAAATKFYAGLFGWQCEDFPGGDMEYKFFKKDGQKIGGMMKRKHGQMPPQWLSYVAVDSVDASVEKAAKLSGKVIVPPFDVPTVGRIAVLQDPQGAAVAVFQCLKE